MTRTSKWSRVEVDAYEQAWYPETAAVHIASSGDAQDVSVVSPMLETWRLEPSAKVHADCDMSMAPSWSTMSMSSCGESMEWAEGSDNCAAYHFGDQPGVYILVTDAILTSGLGLESDDLQWLGTGAMISVLEVVRDEQIQRVRGRVEEPAGWISLVAMDNGQRWAAPVEDVLPADEPSEDVAVDTQPGKYILSMDAMLGEGLDPELGQGQWLKEGTVINVLDVVCNEEAKLVRARIDEPEGWLSLVALDNGQRWAVPLDEVLPFMADVSAAEPVDTASTMTAAGAPGALSVMVHPIASKPLTEAPSMLARPLTADITSNDGSFEPVTVGRSLIYKYAASGPPIENSTEIRRLLTTIIDAFVGAQVKCCTSNGSLNGITPAMRIFCALITWRRPRSGLLAAVVLLVLVSKHPRQKALKHGAAQTA